MSSDGQRSGRAGLEAQRRAIAAACRRHRWQLLELVEEIGRTAEDAKRPGIAEPLRLLVPHRPRRPPLVPGNHPPHAQPNKLTFHLVAECGKCDREDEDSLACLIRGVDAYGTRRLGLRRAAADEFRGARLLLGIGGSKTREWASEVLCHDDRAWEPARTWSSGRFGRVRLASPMVLRGPRG